MTSMSMTDTKKEALILDHVFYIYYSVQFKKDAYGTQVYGLINSESKVNVMTLASISKLGLKVYSTNVGAQKIDSSIFKTFGMVLTSFQVEDKLERARFF